MMKAEIEMNQMLPGFPMITPLAMGPGNCLANNLSENGPKWNPQIAQRYPDRRLQNGTNFIFIVRRSFLVLIILISDRLSPIMSVCWGEQPTQKVFRSRRPLNCVPRIGSLALFTPGMAWTTLTWASFSASHGEKLH